jgi:RHS repeat-associated protein
MKHSQVRPLCGLIAMAAVFFAQATRAQTLPPPPVSPAPVATYEYDAQGNRTKVTKAPGVSGLNLETKATYDPLYRVKDSTDPKNGKTQFEYDGGDHTTKVTDPRNLVTQYPRNGFGDATQLISPDTGTATQTYDEEGNLKTRVDSRGVTETYTYDALNRLTTVVYSLAGQASQTVSWGYDLTGSDYSNSVGRLSRTDHPNGASRFKYDPQGRVTEAIQAVYAASGANSATVVTTVKYGYTLGKLTSITYPSGRKLILTYTSGQLTGLSLAKDANSTAAPLISQVKWEPFGPASGWQWQMTSGLVPHERFYDQYGRVVRYRLGDVFRDITYDAADRIVSYTHLLASNGAAQPALDQSFGYDENDRLTSVTTGTSSWSIAYDANGNRTSVSLNGSPSAYTTSATSNRLDSIANPARSFGYDNAGNTTSDSTNYTATYALTGMLSSLTKTGVTTSFSYDADNRRVRKVTSAGASNTRIFVYDLNGQLLGEYDQAGVALKEYVWLGSTPIAVFTADPSSTSNPPWVYYIHSDHLDTPRQVMDQNGGRRWRWFAEPFGTTAPESNPDNIGAFTLNLRFPGQYADAETGLFYNYFRNYDAGIGRYKESDRLGIDGGVNTYSYVESDPARYFDPNGLVKWNGFIQYSSITLTGRKGVMDGGYTTLKWVLDSDCLRGQKWRVVVKAKAWGFSIGKGAMLGRGSTGFSSTSLDDGLDYINPFVFNGLFEMVSSGAFFRSPFAKYNLGGALGDASGLGLSSDIVSTGVLSGVSEVVSQRLIECDCK